MDESALAREHFLERVGLGGENNPTGLNLAQFDFVKMWSSLPFAPLGQFLAKAPLRLRPLPLLTPRYARDVGLTGMEADKQT